MSTNRLIIDSSDTQRRKQKRRRIVSNKEKFLKRNGNKHLQCVAAPAQLKKDDNNLPCYINQKI